MEAQNINTPLLREATPNDIPAIAHLMGHLGYPTSLEEMEVKMGWILAHPDYHTILAIYQNEVVGFSGLMRGFSFERSGKYVRVISFVVKKEVRNMGIGKILINASEQWAIEQNADNVVISSGNRDERLDAHAFYQKVGYEIKSTGFFKSII